MIWETKIVPVPAGSKGGVLNVFLRGGWEPFAVTWDGSVFDYHLRRQVEE